MTSKRKNGPKLPKRIYAEARVRSASGNSIFNADQKAIRNNLAAYTPKAEDIERAAKALEAAGFDVECIGEVSITIVGSAERYEKVFETRLYTEERVTLRDGKEEGTRTFIDAEGTDTFGLIGTDRSELAELLDGVALGEPVEFFANYFAPLVDYWHLAVPQDVSVAMNADRAHRLGYTGKDVKVVMTDTGWYEHPWFRHRGYNGNVVLGPGSVNPLEDTHGHGTGESANLFSTAPDIDFTMVKMNFFNPVGGFNVAVAQRPAIISNSWGWHQPNGPLSATQQLLAVAIMNATAQGIIVMFSAGNGHWGFPAQMPEVLAIGGTYIYENGDLEASNYASSFESNIYPGRKVPDVTGIVGFQPYANNIMLPVQEGAALDSSMAGVDQTPPNDGWAAFSGTSAACPMVAGIVALMKQANPCLDTELARIILKDTARDVVKGATFWGHKAHPGVDLAQGYGLASGYPATAAARLAWEQDCKQTEPCCCTDKNGRTVVGECETKRRVTIKPAENLTANIRVSEPG